MYVLKQLAMDLCPQKSKMVKMLTFNIYVSEIALRIAWSPIE